MNDKLKDAVVFDVYTRLERGEDGTSCFLALYKAVREGKLAQHQTFLDLCSVFEDRIRHFSDKNDPNLKYGVQYPQNYINFMILLRGHGGNSAQQYGIFQSQLGGPSMRSLR